jgi:hypothetical protein
MKTIKTGQKIYNPVTGAYYPVYHRKSEPGDKQIPILDKILPDERNDH